jgi:uncharacterized protein (TIGR02231 family)
LDEVAVVRGGESKRSFRQREENSLPTTTITYQTSVEFSLDIPFTVPSDGEVYNVELQRHEMPAHYEYKSVPKVEEAAFLTAAVTNWQALNLLDGEASLFFEETYLGKILIDTRAATDTLKLSLGPDRNLIVDRKLLRDYSRRNFTGNKQIDTRAFQITLHNTKAQPVNLLLRDQVPVSADRDINVEPEALDGAQLEEETGIMTWRLQLAPNEQRTLRFSYSVKYPKGANVRLE